MARGLRESIRIRQGTPVAAVSSSKARIEGEALSGVGRAVTGLAGELSRASKRDKDKMLAIFKARDRTEARNEASDAIFNIRKNTKPENADTIDQQFVEAMAPLKEKFDGIGGLRGENAQNAFNDFFGRGKSSLQGTFLSLNNSNIQKQLSTTSRVIIDSVSKNPDSYAEALVQVNELVKTLSEDIVDPKTGLNGSDAYEKTLQNDIGEAAVNGILGNENDPGRYNKARTFISSKMLGINSIAKEEKIKEIDAEEVADSSREVKLLSNERRKDTLIKEEQKDVLLIKHTEAMRSATTVNSKKEILANVRATAKNGIYTKAEVSFFEDAALNPITDVESAQAELEIETMLAEGFSTGNVRRTLQRMMKEGRINGDPALKLMAKLRPGRAAKSPFSREQDKLAESIFRTQFHQDPFDIESKLFEGMSELQALSVRQVSHEYKHGLNKRVRKSAPEAMRQAIRDVIGVNARAVKAFIPQVSPAEQADPIARKAKQREIVIKYKSIPKNKLTRAQMKQFNVQMKAFKQNDIIDKLQEGLDFDLPKKRSNK